MSAKIIRSHIERGRIIDTTPEIVSCMWENWEIYDALLGNRFNIKRESKNVWIGQKKGIKVKIELISKDRNLISGEFKYFVKFRWLWFRPSVIATLKYSRTTDKKTSVEGITEVEFGIIEWTITKFIEKKMNRLANSVIEGGDYTCTLVSKKLKEAKERLSEEQLAILDKYIRKVPFKEEEEKGTITDEGTLSIIPVDGKSIIRLETSVPRPRKIREHVNSFKIFNNLRERYEEKILNLSSTFFDLSRSNEIFSGREELLTLGENFYNKAEDLGKKMYSSYIPPTISAYLTSMLDYSNEVILKVEVEGRDSELPWELLHNKEDFLSLKTDFTRVSLNIVNMAEKTVKFNGFLVIASDPINNLDFVQDEARQIYNIIKEIGVAKVKLIEGKEATKENVLDELETGEYQVFHYSGHSFYNKSNPRLSYLLFENERKLFAHELANVSLIGNLRLAFLNSCFSGFSIQKGIEVLGLADSFVKQGLPYVIGMLWRVSDFGALTLAKEFYNSLTSNNNPIKSLRKARLKSGQAFDWNDPVWAAPIIYTQ